MPFSKDQIVHVVQPSLNHGRPPRRFDCKVAKVGRVWATLENGERFDMVGGRLDGKGYASPGRVWESSEEFDRQRLLLWAWGEFLDKVASFRHHPPGSVSFNRLRQICIELGVPLPSPPPF